MNPEQVYIFIKKIIKNRLESEKKHKGSFMKSTVMGLRSVNAIKSSHTKSVYENNTNHRDSNLSSSLTDLLNGLNANDMENRRPSNKSKASKVFQLHGNRGSHLVGPSSFVRNNNRNNTYCPLIKKNSVFTILEPINQSQKNKKNPGIISERKSSSLDSLPKEKSKFNTRNNQVKNLLKNNLLKEYENRIRSFLRKEKFFLNETNNLKINIPFPYLANIPLKGQPQKQTKKENEFKEYKILSDRRHYKPNSRKNIFFIIISNNDIIGTNKEL